MKILRMRDSSASYETDAVAGHLWWQDELRFAKLDKVGWFRTCPTFRPATSKEAKQLCEYLGNKTRKEIESEAFTKEMAKRNKKIIEFRTRILKAGVDNVCDIDVNAYKYYDHWQHDIKE